MWISDPTKVTSRTKAIDSWSIRRPAASEKLPAGIQLNRCWSNVRPCAGLLSIATYITTAMTKPAQGTSVPSQWPHASVRRPPSSRIAALSSGSATSSQVSVNAPLAFWTSCT